ncbi:septum formation inhibitor Maf [Gramella sp. AN32]|uniref:Septum formation inhibitor Maf n=1 Tax=Christiangramia antarctica TaxID=2058158 RepID=A0ABW5X604_9FLAO|nr:septum formation inhibitor Maf [Gramella sp. AN32]
MLFSCKDSEEIPKDFKLTEEFKDYWFSGEAEITSYDLQQSRYGENREGETVMIFVTEDFLAEEQVKANSGSASNIPVLKLNATKNFVTGIYPYSIMQSDFFPLNGEENAIKISTSIQEWCGQVYMQLNNRSNYKISSHSYFEGEADQDFTVPKAHLENDLWLKLRIAADSLPVGDFKMIPAFEFLRLKHIPVQAYDAFGEYYSEDSLNIYQVEYSEIKRKLKIFYRPYFPFTIEKWEESYESGFGENAKMMTSTGVKKARLKIDYWNKNAKIDISLRDQLKLK